MHAWLMHMRAAMESEQIFRVAKTEKLWEREWEVWRTSPVAQDIMYLVGVCVVWLIVLYGFYSCKVFIEGRQREARQKKLVDAHRVQSDGERAAIEHHWPWPEVQSRGNSVLAVPFVPRRRRSRSASVPINPGTNATTDPNGGSEELPVMMCTPSCTFAMCAQELKELASELRAPRQDIRCFDVSGWVVATQLHLGAETVNKLREIAAKEFCVGAITVQLGRLRACCLLDGEVKTLKLDATDLVPVILHSSYAGGLLTVEGFNLAQATIQIASMHNGAGDSIKESKHRGSTLETESNEGGGGLEIHTCMCELPKEHSVAEVSVIAYMEIVKDGHELRVSSLPVLIQDDSLKTVLRDILPFTILSICAATHILLNVIYATSVVAWLVPPMIIALTQILPQSTETTIKLLLKKLTVHVYFSFYYAIRAFLYEFHAYVSTVDEEDEDFPSRKSSNTKRPRSWESMSYPVPEEESFGGNDDDEQILASKLKAPEVQAENFVAVHGSGSVLSSNWQWPIYDTIYKEKRSYLKLREESKDKKAEDTKMVPFVVVYLHLKSLPWANQVQVNISSPFLKRLLSDKMDRWGCKKIVSIDGPELFRCYEELKEQHVSCLAKLESLEPSSSADANSNKEELQHITHLVRFMDEEFEEMTKMHAAMKIERRVTWEMLWAFLPPGERVLYLDDVTDETVCAEVLWTNYQETQQGLILAVKVTKWDYNCQTWSEYSNSVTVSAFEGDRPISSLNIRPVQFEEDPNATEESFLQHGKRFCELSMMESSCYMNYKGSMVSYILVDKCLRVVKENADGRVMIDLGSFSKMNPDYPLGSAKPPCDVIRDNIVITLDITMNPNRMFAPSFVYGFSFRLKKWGCFSVCGFSDIEFNDSAYDDLVMNPTTKALTESLVREHLKEGRNKVSQDNDRVDPIANKGEGCILLCYGPPGTGKTLTAESLSEKLHCPLWCLSVFELGVTPAELETMLVKVLDVVASWGAILLLDEADVYLERRSSKDLTRNAMTGVFLRRLEYYRGVLFLTTNRDSAFDEAICSRIAMFLYYGRHNEHQRSAIWTNLFRRVGLKDVSNEDLAEFSKPDFNGREIRKIMKTAQTLAKSKKEKLNAQHVREALTVYEESSRLRTSSNPPAAGSLPVHQHPNNAPLGHMQWARSNSAIAPTLSELPSSSSETNPVDDCPPLTPSSSSHSSQPSHISECLDPSGIIEQHDSM